MIIDHLCSPVCGRATSSRPTHCVFRTAECAYLCQVRQHTAPSPTDQNAFRWRVQAYHLQPAHNSMIVTYATPGPGPLLARPNRGVSTRDGGARSAWLRIRTFDMLSDFSAATAMAHAERMPPRCARPVCPAVWRVPVIVCHFDVCTLSAGHLNGGEGVEERTTQKPTASVVYDLTACVCATERVHTCNAKGVEHNIREGTAAQRTHALICATRVCLYVCFVMLRRPENR